MFKHLRYRNNTRGKKTFVALLAATLAMALAALDIDLPAAAMPKIAAQLHGTSSLGEALSLYLVCSVGAMLCFGWLSDLYGRRQIFLWSITVFFVGSILAAGAESMPVFLCARALQGCGAGALPVLAIALSADIVPAQQVGKVQAVMNMVWGISAGMGPLLGWGITDSWTWRALFWMNLPLCLLVSLLAARYFPGHVFKNRTPVSQQAEGLPQQHIASPRSWRARRTLLCLAQLLFGAVIFLYVAYMPLYVYGVLYGGAGESGLFLAPLSIAWTLSALVVGVAMERWMNTQQAWNRLMLIGVLVIVCSLFGVHALLLAHPASIELLLIVAGVTALGCGGGMFNGPAVVAVQLTVPREVLGLSTALFEASYSLGGAAGVWVGDAVMHVVSNVNAPHAGTLLFAIRLVFAMACVLACLLCSVVVLLQVMQWRPKAPSL